MIDRRKQTLAIRRKLRQRRTVPWLLAGIVLILLAIIVAQQLFNFASVLPPETGSDTLLLYALSSLNFAAFIVFSFILLRSLLSLRRERRERQPGSRIQTRLLVYFIGLSLLPITAMAAFSYLFLNRSIEKWMGRLPENVVERVREQQREGLALQNEKLRETATLLAATVRARPQADWQMALDQLSATGRLAAIEIVSDNGQVIAHAEAAIPGFTKRGNPNDSAKRRAGFGRITRGRQRIRSRFGSVDQRNAFDLWCRSASATQTSTTRSPARNVNINTCCKDSARCVCSAFRRWG